MPTAEPASVEKAASPTEFIVQQPQLTHHQYEILSALARAASASEAAEQLGLELVELSRELTTIREVLGVTSTAAALNAVAQEGYAE